MAAIAVPNFLEAQVRSKVSRAKADMRSIATAIEAYSADWNRPMLRQGELARAKCCSVGAFYNAQPEGTVQRASHAMLTTPVAYMTSILNDPFTEKGTKNWNTGGGGRTSGVYGIQSFGAGCFETDYPGSGHFKAWRMGYTWALCSRGPGRNNRGNIVNLVTGTMSGAQNEEHYVYNPSNGTVSMGWILRTNKGEFHYPGN
ncbi:MAG: hypothetical protein NTW86_03995 [Candidatus Sumerlaeota bacterium]|nr:hypothetical protein [Candidatus Sumerlaeota bacterium]